MWEFITTILGDKYKHYLYTCTPQNLGILGKQRNSIFKVIDFVSTFKFTEKFNLVGIPDTRLQSAPASVVVAILGMNQLMGDRSLSISLSYFSF